MEPIPESAQALDEIDAISVNGRLREGLRRASDGVRALVPSCVGLSLSVLRHGVTLTLVASDDEIAVLDAVQYLEGGPCVEATTGHRLVMSSTSELDENDWHLFSAATAAHGVASTLSLPVLQADVVVASVNLYAATPHAFDDHHEELAAMLGAWAGGAVRNADLSFSTRLAAQRAPQVLEDVRRTEIAVGILAVRRKCSVSESRAELERAAAAAGLPLVAVADTVIALLGDAGP